MVELGDTCPDCGHVVTETTAGATVAYCWYCHDRTANDDPREWDERTATW